MKNTPSFLNFQMKMNVNIDPVMYLHIVQIFWEALHAHVFQDIVVMVYIAKVS